MLNGKIKILDSDIKIQKGILDSMRSGIKLILNSRFKQQIEDYQKQVLEEDPYGTAFSVLLKNADISYFDAPIEKISWCE
jgi:hypothetical protein